MEFSVDISHASWLKIIEISGTRVTLDPDVGNTSGIGP